MKKQLLVILSAACIAAGAAGGLALKQVSAEEPVSGKATVTRKPPFLEIHFWAYNPHGSTSPNSQLQNSNS